MGVDFSRIVWFNVDIMKTNHRSQADRLRDRIANLENSFDPDTKPYGGENPYHYCIGCLVSVIYVFICGIGFNENMRKFRNRYEPMLDEYEQKKEDE